MNKFEAQEHALSLKEQKLTYRQVAAEIGVTVGSATYLVRCARLRLAESPILTDRLRVHPDWSTIDSTIDINGVGQVWGYWPNIPDEAIWTNAYPSEITATNDGYLVEAPYVEYSEHSSHPWYVSEPGAEVPMRYKRHYASDADLIEDLPLIQEWRHPFKAEDVEN
ncbi:hypothetical protein CIK76_18840 [Glutamicibacter sp. BW80]|uniref:hypothetical protein n=1 Tax=Glutamicibacter sp. BW80 TaxID=2024404 RepID=UPI000BB83315|nr:hypothetical protein [Glutamicibacter sp. BW80]PCC27052.1 hypothetical protein CIK76_18840 [Glutamicibacter sp. BW80]